MGEDKRIAMAKGSIAGSRFGFSCLSTTSACSNALFIVMSPVYKCLCTWVFSTERKMLKFESMYTTGRWHGHVIHNTSHQFLLKQVENNQ